jgi:hypothetical protein
MKPDRPGRFRLLMLLVLTPLRTVDPAKGAARRFADSTVAPILWLKWELSGISGSRLPVFSSRFALLEFAVNAAHVDGLHLEFGVYRGESINHLASITRHSWVGFDSFEGLPRRWSPRVRAGAFSTSGRLPSVARNVTLVKGWFSDTIPEFLKTVPGTRTSFVHVDCDLYQSTRSVLTALQDSLVAGSVLVFDEFTWVLPDDEARALREWRAETGHELRYIGCSLAGSVAVQLLV